MKKDIFSRFFFLIFTIFFLVSFSFAKSLDSETLLKMLNNLKVASDCVSPKYSRKEWNYKYKTGQGEYSTREKVLIEESLVTPTIRVDEKNRKTISGRWYDSYNDQLFKNSRQLEIDHLVPLSEAHKSGACRWDKEKKEKYATYLEHKEELIAVSKKANRAKGGKDPAKWLPSNEDYLCDYVSDWLTIKTRWRLWVDKEEKEVIAGVIENYCLE